MKKKKEKLEDICKYATKRERKFQGITTCYDCKKIDEIICFIADDYKNCYYYQKKGKIEGNCIPGCCMYKD